MEQDGGVKVPRLAQIYQAYIQNTYYKTYKRIGNASEAFQATVDTYQAVFMLLNHKETPEYVADWVNKLIEQRCIGTDPATKSAEKQAKF